MEDANIARIWVGERRRSREGDRDEEAEELSPSVEESGGKTCDWECKKLVDGLNAGEEEALLEPASPATGTCVTGILALIFASSVLLLKAEVSL